MSKENIKSKDLYKWTSDCCGKQDYDGPVLSLETRLWPDNTAISSVILGSLEDGPYETLCEASFEGETEAEVKHKVEKWVEEITADLISYMRMWKSEQV